MASMAGAKAIAVTVWPNLIQYVASTPIPRVNDGAIGTYG